MNVPQILLLSGFSAPGFCILVPRINCVFPWNKRTWRALYFEVRKWNDLSLDTCEGGRGGGKRNNSGTYHVLVNLIGYNGYVITSGDVENVKYMVATEHRAARIRRIVYNNRRGWFVDLRLQVVQIDLPTEFRLRNERLILIRCIRERSYV